jgi:cob(I)alamin adenosyltransferase
MGSRSQRPTPAPGHVSERSAAPEPAGASPIYTRTGDAGATGLCGSLRVRKDDARVEAYGTVDELAAAVGVLRAFAAQQAGGCPALASLLPRLLRVQNELFVVGSSLATVPEERVPSTPRIGLDAAVRLESDMDECSAELPELASFVLPGGSPLNALAHQARTVCRRAERRCVALSGHVDPAIIVYLNRLSDALFVWARWVAAQQGVPETPWKQPL